MRSSRPPHPMVLGVGSEMHDQMREEPAMDTGQAARTAFMKKLAEDLADLNPFVGDDEDTGLFVVVPIDSAAWAYVDANEYGMVSVQEASDPTGHMVGGYLARGLVLNDDVATVVRGLVRAEPGQD